VAQQEVGTFCPARPERRLFTLSPRPHVHRRVRPGGGRWQQDEL